MFDQFLNTGSWVRPSDKMAVYTEILPGSRWGIRVTLFPDSARVEAIDDPKCTWYHPPTELAVTVGPPTLLERLRGVTFADKLRKAVEEKREYARRQNRGRGR